MLFTPEQRAFFAKIKAERKAYNEREDVIQMKKEKRKEYLKIITQEMMSKRKEMKI
jgi:hypothetical protein